MDRRNRDPSKRKNNSKIAQKYKLALQNEEKIKNDIQAEKLKRKQIENDYNLLWLSSTAVQPTSHSVIKTCTGCAQCEAMPGPDKVCLTVAVNKN